MPDVAVTVVGLLMALLLGVVGLLWLGARTPTVMQHPGVYGISALGIGLVAAGVAGLVIRDLAAALTWGLVTGVLGGFLVTLAWATWIRPPADR